ncbi:hypothetical protein BCR36DRAFT_30218 [Piromyces finnis]|uniref:Suppressor of forked domain-containing protein n=1 Tax=Piromyces finnis TaxID=1754191 RepID=A0A1Y1VC94_9FUNG|nr:hypothetical protein BCR36DRAFT_30218 [Piromyces finnis]|eukprot:ORX52497.1 hypothetical protein BCR36DRAFT_30218 [Piromyces finnis]
MMSEEMDKMDVLNNESDNEEKGNNNEMLEIDTENLSSQWNKIPTVSSSGSSNKKNTSTTKLDRFQKLQAKVTNDPWDCDSWTNLLTEAQQKGNPTVIRETYDQFLKQFPTSHRHWISYVNYELKQKAYERVEAIFKRCLHTVPNVELWKHYLNYVKKTHSGNAISEEKKAEARQVIGEAYDYVLQHIGTDKNSGSIWQDYLYFVKNNEINSTFEEQKNMLLLRKIYHKVLVIPIANIEQIWKEYDTFENNINKLAAKNFISDRSPSYMLARSLFRELKNILDNIEKIQKNYLAQPPSWSEKDYKMLEAWKEYIKWEKGNPLKLKEDLMIKRVIYAYKQALLTLRYFPEIWYEYSTYLNESGKTEDSIFILKSASEVLPNSLLINFALAEAHELKLKTPAESLPSFVNPKQIYETLIKSLENEIDKVDAKYNTKKTRLLALVSTLNSPNSNDPIDNDNDEQGKQNEKIKEKEKEIKEIEKERNEKVKELKQRLGLAWIVFMRFSRRSEGLKAARGIFIKARKSKYCVHQVYIASALMEYQMTKQSVIAGRIFELGMKVFASPNGVSDSYKSEEAQRFISEYMDWLISLNDDNNSRALFERALSILPNDNANEIWDKFTKYENDFGDLAGLLRVEKRILSSYPHRRETKAALVHLANRYQYLDINVIAKCELGIQDNGDRLIDLNKATANNSVDTQAVTAVVKPMNRVHRIGSVDLDNSDEDRGKRFSTLFSVHPERYPRPDFGRWVPYKPDHSHRFQNMNNNNMHNINPTMNNMNNHNNNGNNMMMTNHSSSLIHESISKFLKSLPPAQKYDGPILPVDELMEIFRNIPKKNLIPPNQPYQNNMTNLNNNNNMRRNDNRRFMPRMNQNNMMNNMGNMNMGNMNMMNNMGNMNNMNMMNNMGMNNMGMGNMGMGMGMNNMNMNMGMGMGMNNMNRRNMMQGMNNMGMNNMGMNRMKRKNDFNQNDDDSKKMKK